MEEIADKYPKIYYYIDKLDNNTNESDDITYDSLFQQNITYRDKPNPIQKTIERKNIKNNSNQEEDIIINKNKYLYTNSIWETFACIIDETTTMIHNLKQERTKFMKQTLRDFVYNNDFYKFVGWRKHNYIIQLFDNNKIEMTDNHINALAYLMSFIFSKIVVLNGLEVSFNNSICKDTLNYKIENNRLKLI